MKAAVLESPGKIVVRDVPTPEVGPGSVLIAVRACAICSTDLRTFKFGRGGLEYPIILGHEVAGEVASVGDGVSDFKPGDRVTINPRVACGECFYCRRGQPAYCERHKSFGGALKGGLAEYMLAPERAVKYGAVIPFPATLDYPEAALAEPLACCIRGQEYAEVKKGDTVLIIGGGPIGILHSRLAKAKRAGKILLSDRNTTRLSSNYLSAVDRLIDAAKEDVKGVVMAATDKRGADVVIIACSSREAQQEALGYVNFGGRIAFFAGLNPGEPPTCIDANLVHYREVKISGTHGSTPPEMREAIRLIETGQIKVSDLITTTYPLDKAPEVFAAAAAKSGMKVVVRP